VSTEREHPVDYLPELALGALPETEAAPIREHLEGCATCMADYTDMARVANFLPLAADDVAPSPAVKASLMERIARQPGPIEPRAHRPLWPAAVAASAAILLIAGALAGFLVGRTQNDEDALRAQIAALRASGQRDSSLVQAAARGTLQTSEARQGDAWAAFVRAPGSTWGYVWVDGLPPLPAGKAYQAWFSRDGLAYEPNAVFEVSKGGVWLWTDSKLDQYQDLQLTIEDAGGAKSPGADVILAVDLVQH
jgi:hypothetical protein